MGDDMATQQEVRPGGIFEGYQVDSLLGRGANADVHLARHRDGSWHALKVLRDLDSRRQIRVQQEAVFRRERLGHPNIVPATQAIDVYGAPGLIMDFVEGPSLEEHLRDKSPDLLDLLSLFRGILLGVQHAHEHDVVHRDLKPSNILLQPGPQNTWVPRISDFGLAKALASDLDRFGGLTTVNTSLGTTGYAAPEQIRDASTVDHRADLYSLGCLLFELVCGVAPFAGLSTFDTLAAQRKDQFPAPEELAPGLPPSLYALIRQLMSADRDQRPDSAAEVLAAVDAAYFDLEGQGDSSDGAVLSLGPILMHLVPALLLCLFPLGGLVLGATVVFLAKAG